MEFSHDGRLLAVARADDSVTLWDLTLNRETCPPLRGHTWITRWMNLKPNVPYGVAFAIGGFLAFPETWWMNFH